MRKSFKKILALAMAAAMVVTAAPVQSAQAAGKVAKVSTQKELNKALKDDSVTKIKIVTDDDTTFKIKEGDYTDKTVVVDAPNADVKNKGEFKKVKGKEVGKWVEKADGNDFVITSQDSKIVVKKSADVESITYKGEGAKADLKVQGTVGEVSLEATVEMNVSGKAEKVIVVVAEAAKGSTVTATITIEITANADVKVTLGKGAEGSTVTTTDETVKAEIKNETTADVTVTTPAGEETVGAGSETTTETPSGDNTDTGSDSSGTGGGSGNGGSGDGGSGDSGSGDGGSGDSGSGDGGSEAETLDFSDLTITVDKVNNIAVSGPAVSLTGSAIEITSGSAVTVTGSAVSAVSDGSIKLDLTLNYPSSQQMGEDFVITSVTVGTVNTVNTPYTATKQADGSYYVQGVELKNSGEQITITLKYSYNGTEKETWTHYLKINYSTE